MRDRPLFVLPDFAWAAIDWLNAHPLVYGAVLTAAALVVWCCGRLAAQEAERLRLRRVRAAHAQALLEIAAGEWRERHGRHMVQHRLRRRERPENRMV